MAADTRDRIVDAARDVVLADGYASLSTRRVADRAGVPLSQIHYHFGGRQGLVLALLASENERRVTRQAQMYAEDAPLHERYDQACDFLDDDLASGYVRILQEMVAAGWSDPEVADQVTALLGGWFDLLGKVVAESEAELGSLGSLRAEDIAMLVGMAFLGGETLLLLGDRWPEPVTAALRRVGDLIRAAEPS
jgi:AcrR family transcriptional regulator